MYTQQPGAGDLPILIPPRAGTTMTPSLQPATEDVNLPVVAALFVETHGIYSTIPGVEVWGVERDARTYAGPHRVVAHPPCQRWGRYWSGGPSARERRVLGDDGGCFTSALASVRRWGGVLEHPEASHAWAHHDLLPPPKTGGWLLLPCGGWTCCVEQGHYGHRARKATWLYAFGVGTPPQLRWGKSGATLRLEPGFHSAAERAAASDDAKCVERLAKHERAATPFDFAFVLLAIAMGEPVPA